MKPLLVGEANPYGSPPGWALYPLPVGASGDRLRRIFGMTLRQYLRAFERVNLCPHRWSTVDARMHAQELRSNRPGVPFILLGSKVAGAFGLKFQPFTRLDSLALLMLPHPSGRCRLWSEPGAEETARRLVGEWLRG